MFIYPGGPCAVKAHRHVQSALLSNLVICYVIKCSLYLAFINHANTAALSMARLNRKYLTCSFSDTPLETRFHDYPTALLCPVNNTTGLRLRPDQGYTHLDMCPFERDSLRAGLQRPAGERAQGNSVWLTSP